jgi:phosphoribosyl-AMP cyclohydrolase
VASGRAWFRSRRRGLWEKGATSGNYMDVVEAKLDCDMDSVLLLVRPRGPACHTGARSCFFNNA